MYVFFLYIHMYVLWTVLSTCVKVEVQWRKFITITTGVHNSTVRSGVTNYNDPFYESTLKLIDVI